MVSAQWIALTDLHPLRHHHPVGPPLEVEGGELRGFEGMTTVCGPWLGVVDFTVGAQLQPVTDWKTAMSLRHGGTEDGARERVPASAAMEGPVPM